MKKIISISLLLCCYSGVYAEPSSLVAFDKETRALIRSGDAARGEKLADDEDCKKCHNMNGLSDDTEDPNIAGLSATYAFKQMKDYQDGNRDERSMYKAVRDLSDQDLADLATYYAQQPRQPALHATDGIPVLVNKGDPGRMIRACNSCHGQKGQGGEYDMPYIAGQRRGYFILAMEEFQEEDRANDIYWRMRDIARQLTEEEIEQLADYYASADPEDNE